MNTQNHFLTFCHNLKLIQRPNFSCLSVISIKYVQIVHLSREIKNKEIHVD